MAQSSGERDRVRQGNSDASAMVRNSASQGNAMSQQESSDALSLRASEERAHHEATRLARIIALQHEIAMADLDLDRIMQLVAERAQELTNASGAAIEMIDGDWMVYRVATGSAEPFVGLRLAAATSLSGRAVQTSSVLSCDDAEIDPRVDREACRRVGVRLMIVIPLHHGSSPVGVLKVVSDDVSAFDMGDAGALELLAGFVGASMGQATLYEAGQELLRERTDALAALAESEERYRSFVEHHPDAIFAIGLDGTILMANPGAERVSGYRPEELVNRSFSEVLPAEEMGRIGAFLGDMMSGKAGSFETYMRHRDGQRVDLATTTIPMMSNGEVVGFYGVTRDITQQRQTEARLARQANLTRLLHLAAVAANESDTIEEALQTTIDAVCTRSGWPVGHAYLRDYGGESGISNTRLWHLDDPERYRAFREMTEQNRLSIGVGMIGSVFSTGQPVWIPDVTTSPGFIRAQVGHTLGVRAGFAIPVMDGDETVAVLEFFSPDVVERDDEMLMVMEQVGFQLGRAFERERVRAELAAFSERLEWSNHELQDFASVASHDLQEPLRKVMAFGDRLKSKYGDELGEQGRDYVERMQNASGRMQVLINDLLSYSRVTTKARPFGPVDLCQVVREVVSDLEERIAEDGGRVEIEALPIVYADELQMRQLFQNLIANGLKFRAPDRPPVVRVRVEAEARTDVSARAGAEEPGMPRISAPPRLIVEDKGIGFKPQYGDRIFSIFERLHGRDEYEGTGIGLAICRKIVERHGGTIVAEGSPNVGARFIVTLPAATPVKLAGNVETTSW